MANVIDRIPDLIEHGKKITFENFATKTAHGFPNAFSEDWLVWTHHVSVVVDDIDAPSIAASIKRGLAAKLLGNGQDRFEGAKDSILSGLRAAQRVLGKPVPASDRTVTLGHNSQEQKEALAKLDDLIAEVRATNDFSGDPEEKEQLIAELSAGRRLLEAAKVRVSAARAALQPSLKWILEKAGGAVIGKIAGDLWQYLVHLQIF